MKLSGLLCLFSLRPHWETNVPREPPLPNRKLSSRRGGIWRMSTKSSGNGPRLAHSAGSSVDVGEDDGEAVGLGFWLWLGTGVAVLVGRPRRENVEALS